MASEEPLIGTNKKGKGKWVFLNIFFWIILILPFSLSLFLLLYYRDNPVIYKDCDFYNNINTIINITSITIIVIFTYVVHRIEKNNTEISIKPLLFAFLLIQIMIFFFSHSYLKTELKSSGCNIANNIIGNINVPEGKEVSELESKSKDALGGDGMINCNTDDVWMYDGYSAWDNLGEITGVNCQKESDSDNDDINDDDDNNDDDDSNDEGN